MRVGLGVTGGIAAYKAAEVLRLLQERGLDVQVIMTRAACEFITPLTFAALSGRSVITDLFEPSGEKLHPENGRGLDSTIEHIGVAQAIDALLIAPATADVLAQMAQGAAGSFLTTVYLATRAPVIVAPAMNVNMWTHAATRANLSVLRERGVQVIEPDAGYLACGMTGAGRLAAPEQIAGAVFKALGLREDLKSESLLITAGPTEEPIDPVRHLTNRSSGKMGYALAEAARRRGARVVLVSGPTRLDPPKGVAFENARTADQMAEAVWKNLDGASVVVMAAAVADYQAESVASRKLKKSNGSLTIRLKPTRDILTEIGRRRRHGQLLVGFAAETDNVLENAAEKLASKNLDLMVANDVTRDDAGFDVDTNVVTLLFPGGRTKALDKASKLDVAHRVLDEVVELRKSRG
ncbi:MAG: bifunctional phosphopantothenoylcysteine decarboxylase/phosphopantothenate--cysteine ligase CoaBC [Terriglobia bacterium]